MRFIKKHKKIFTLLTAVLLIAISLGVFAGKTWAAYDTWNSLVELEFRTGVGEGQHSMIDVSTYGGRYTNDVGKIYSDRSHFFDDIRLEASSRVTYGRKIRVNFGQRFAIIAAKEDTADAGGSTENAGLQFYWSVGEFDENGNIVFDGGWRGSNGTWTVGEADRNVSGAVGNSDMERIIAYDGSSDRIICDFGIRQTTVNNRPPHQKLFAAGSRLQRRSQPKIPFGNQPQQPFPGQNLFDTKDIIHADGL